MRSADKERKEVAVKGKTYISASMKSSSLASASPSRDHRLNLYAQEMNNSAISCIEIGHYGRAVASLGRALKLYKHQQHSNDITPCNCYHCTLDACIIRADECHLPSSNVKIIRADGDCNTSPSGGYIARRAIKVSARGHTMGPALYLIIVYNLGLAKHLIAIESSSDKSLQKKIIHGAITSYNLAYELQAKLLQHENSTEKKSSLESIRFKMIILNNMSQLYKLNCGIIEHDHCLRRLLSIIMMVLDQQMRASNTESSTTPMWRIEMDGFLQNTASLVLQPEYTANSA